MKQHPISHGQPPITLNGHDHAYLASFQKNQGATNDCAAYAVAAAISILRGGHRVDYTQVVEVANRRTTLLWGGLFGLYGLIFGGSLRLWPGGPITPRQQARLARVVARKRGMKVKTQVMKGAPADLLHYLAKPNMAVLVTLGWDNTYRPRIVYARGDLRSFAEVGFFHLATGKSIRYPFAAHVMVLAAYDPARTVQDGNETIHIPWGFVSSWLDDGGELFWMPDDDFQAAWEYDIKIGSNMMVIVESLGESM